MRLLILSLVINLTLNANVQAVTQSLDVTKRELKLHGAWQQGGVIRGKASKSVHSLKLNQQSIQVHPSGDFIFAFARKATPTNNTISYQKLNKIHTTKFSIAKQKYKIQRIDGIPNNKVNVPKKQLKRIYTEYALSRKARKKNRSINHFSQDFKIPVTGIVTGVYGSQRILNGKPRRPHFGLDIAAPTGTPVVAPASGFIEMTHDDMYFSGGTLILNHGLGVTSTFLHLDEILVKEGQFIKQGGIIAKVGATGRVTGAHLDWRMNWFEVRFNPVLILSTTQQKRLDPLN